MSENTATATKKRIFQRRAKILAEDTRGARDDHARIGIVEIKLAHERYAVESEYVREVLPLKDVTPLPCTPSYVLGLINLRGQIISVIDLRVFFELPRESATKATKVVVLQSSEMEVGIVADVVVEARSISPADIRPALPTMTGIREAYVHGIEGDDLVILDAAKLLADKSIVVNEQVDGE